MIYLDNAASTKIDESVLQKMLPLLKEMYGNPSSLHKIGRNAQDILSESRKIIADSINGEENEIFFTSCGSESNNLILLGVSNSSQKRKHIITTQIEHPSVLNVCKYLEKRGVEITYLAVNPLGYISIEELEDSITEHTILISIMFANNEIGTIQQIKSIAAVAHKNNILFHTDAIQAIGHTEIDVNDIGVDLLSASAHKFNGPKGAAFAFIREGVLLEKLLHGGKQEKGMRAGTENVVSIYGMAIALSNNIITLNENKEHVKLLMLDTIRNVENLDFGIKINGDVLNGLPGLLSLTIPQIESEVITAYMDSLDICISSGSACSNLTNSYSHVLHAIGLSDAEIKSTIRISFGKNNNASDVTSLIRAFQELKDVTRNNFE